MNILLINHYAGSPQYGMEYRPFYLSREWVKQGHKVTVVASSFSHVRTSTPDTNSNITLENIDGIQYVWLRTPAYHGNGVGRIRNMLSFVWQLRKFEQKLLALSTPEVVIASSTYPLDIYPAFHMARLTGAKLVFEVHDLWPLSPMELGGIPEWHPYIVVMQFAENYAYQHSDRVVSILPKTLEHMKEHGLTPEKFVHIPNGIDIEEWSNKSDDVPEEHVEALKAMQRSGYAIVGYAGAHGMANALDAFIDAASLVQDQPVKFVLVGSGPEKSFLQNKAARRGLRNVIFLSAVSRNAITALLEMMDFLFIGLKKQPLFRFGVSPNKLMDYMMAGKPIIYAISAGNDMVSESGCGISIPPEAPEAIAGAVKQLLAMPVSEREKMGLKGKSYVMANHDYKRLAEDFIKVMN